MLHIHRAERADRLVEALGDLLAAPLADPLEAEVVAVPTRGVERWLTQRLSCGLGASPGRSDGVCAHVDFPFPGRLVGGAVAAAAGIDRESDPWLPERLVWPLLEVVDRCLDEPWLAMLARHLGAGDGEGDGDGGGSRRGRRFASIRRVADLYDRYGVHRPEMLISWAEGHDTDGTGRPLPTDAGWQAELWRRLRSRIGRASPAERLGQACTRLVSQPALAGLPQRVSLFGLTRLPASYLRVLSALSQGRDVHLFLLHPSAALWDRVAQQVAGAEGLGALRRHDDPTAGVPKNPLLASWGRDAREMQLVLSADAMVDEHRGVAERGDSLLQRIQADVRADRAPPGVPLGHEDRRRLLDPSDGSLQVHACHGRARQVEVLRDAILHLLADDPTLEARDIIVMCPDIEAFAPLIHATFGAGETGDGDEADQQLPGDLRPPDLRVRLADRSLRQTNPVLAVVSELLDLASARVTAAQLLDLAGREPLRRRFHLDDDDMSRLEEWVVATGIRWGLDGPHRAPFKLDQLEANTWRAGVDRVLVGVAMADEDQRLVGGVLPLDDVDSGSIDLAGRLAELVARVQVALDVLAGPLPVAGWAEAIATAADLLTATSSADSWQRAQLQRLLDDVVSEAASGDGGALELSEVRALLADRLRGRPTRANFRTGHLTICTLVPMRSVPHRVVCLLGLDDGTFPRHGAPDGDDLIAADPYVGDRDARSEDRQLLLDALLAATETLLITYTGRDERTNAPRPPAVPVGELLDVVDRTVRTDPAAGGRRQLVVHHPLQPYDPRNFTPGRLMATKAWSFDPVALAGARAMSGPRQARPPFLRGRLPPVAGEVVEVEQLVRFLQHPVKAFLRERLGISLVERSQELDDALPVELDPLERWQVGQRLLDARLAGAAQAACVAAERARGILPPGSLAEPSLEVVLPIVETLLEAAGEVAGAGGETGSVDVNVELPDGRMLVGTVTGLIGGMLRTVTYSRLGPKHRLAAWARFLALSAAHPDGAFEAATIGRAREGAKRGATVSVARLAPPAPGAAGWRQMSLAHLADLVSLYDRGMCEPLPLYCATSAAHAGAVAMGKDPGTAARKVWESEWQRDREDKDLEHQLVLGGVRSFAEVLEALPCEDEDGAGWEAAEPSRFGRYSRRLWDNLLATEELFER